MTERLQGALAEIADRAPVAQVPADTYRRGRRSHRHRIAAGLAALALVVVAAAALGTDAVHGDPPIADRQDPGAVPSHLYGVPERLTAKDGQGRWVGPIETDLAIGTSSVAWQTTVGGPPVVITAADGAYHLLALPGFLGNDLGWSGLGPALSLSPDGRWLAYAWSAGTLGSGSGASGIRVVDLESGKLRTIPLESDQLGTLVLQITWSPDSRWIAWYGGTAVSANSLHGSVRGVIAPGATLSLGLPSPRDAATAMAVDDSGRVALVTSGRTLLVSSEGATTRLPARLPPAVSMAGEPTRATFSPDGRLSLPSPGRAPGATVLDLSTGRVLSHPFPDGVYPGTATVQPLGWVDDDHVVAEVTPWQGGRSSDSQVVVMTPTRNRTSTYRIVTHSDPTVPEKFSVAVDLMSPDHYTEDLPAPDWPWSPERKMLVALGSIAAAGLVAWMVYRRLRYLVRR